MPRLKSEPLRSWSAPKPTKPFSGTILRNSLFSKRLLPRSDLLTSHSPSNYTVKTGLHPLHTYWDFNDVQACITEAILVHGQPCPIDYILDFVSARWKSLRHRDGTPYNSDIRKVTMANLNNHPAHVVLFEQSKTSPNKWVLGTTYSEGLEGFGENEESSSEQMGLNSSTGSLQRSNLNRPIRTRSTKRKRSDMEENSSSEDFEESLMPGGRDAAYLLDLPRKKPKVYTSEELSYDASLIPPEELLERVKESKLTNLQILISISIIRNTNYEARLDYILDFVCQNYAYLLGRDGNPKATDPKRAVLASLSKNASSSPLFIRVGDVWKIGPKNVLYGCKYVIPGLMEYITVSKAPGDSVELTELQKMIMRAIALDGGTCALERIYEYVKPRYDRLKRRDGTSYASNARRAIQASLSNNSSNRPIFQLVGTNSNEETLWSLTERGQEALELINTNEPEIPLSDEEDSTVDTTSANDTKRLSNNKNNDNDTKMNGLNEANTSTSEINASENAESNNQQQTNDQNSVIQNTYFTHVNYAKSPQVAIENTLNRKNSDSGSMSPISDSTTIGTPADDYEMEEHFQPQSTSFEQQRVETSHTDVHSMVSF